MHGRLRYTGGTGGGFTNNAEYDVLGWAGSAGSLVAVVVDDNGDVVAAQGLNSSFVVAELYYTERVI